QGGRAPRDNGPRGYYGDPEPYPAGAIPHAPAVVIPACLAVGEKEGVDGRRFLAAVVLGNEVACRVSYALDPVALYDRGFHPSAIAGAFGAAAAAGFLFRLRPEPQAVAPGAPRPQARGRLAGGDAPAPAPAPTLTPARPPGQGRAAASLARLGFGGPPAPFEGKYDAFTAFSGAGHPEALLADWGRRFHLPGFAYKRYSSCAFTHPGLDAL